MKYSIFNALKLLIMKRAYLLIIILQTSRLIGGSLSDGSSGKNPLAINVYYTGLNRVASISENGGRAKRFSVISNNEISIPVTIGANSQSWYIIK